jgi:hypothetical protein
MWPNWTMGRRPERNNPVAAADEAVVPAAQRFRPSLAPKAES